MARPASRVREAQHLQEGALLMLSPRGGRADNGWWMGDELCHQTRGLKDGPLECYQSCLDQDVRLLRSSVFALLVPSPPAALTPPGLPFPSLPSSCAFLLLPPCASSPASFLPYSLFACSVASFVFLFFPLFPPFLPPASPPLRLSSVFSNSGPLLLVTPPLTCYVGRIFYFKPNYFSDAFILICHSPSLTSPQPHRSH